MDFKNIHIGQLIEKRVKESKIDLERMCRFLDCTADYITTVFVSESIDSQKLLRWSKLLEYDFFRIYSQHIVLYSPMSSSGVKKSNSVMPQFKKNIYTRELIFFILEMISKGVKTKQQVMEEYKIPKTTLYKWIYKYREVEDNLIDLDG